MANALQSLAEIFNKRLFRIPDYQRGYAWGRRQWEDFWADLERTARTQRTHYCGQLTLELAPERDWSTWTEEAGLIRAASYKPYFVVDGQQRLTTGIILIQALLEKLEDDGLFAGESVSDHRAKFLVKPSGQLRHCLFGYANDNPSHLYFRTQILKAPSNEYSGLRTLYTTNLEEALGFFRRKVIQGDTAEREAWFSALSQRLLFNVYELTTDIDVFVAFETMNNRGKPLTRLELLKNRLIYLSTLATENSEEERNLVRRNVNAVWRTIYQELGRNPRQQLDDDEFLRAHLIIYFPDTSDSDPLTQFLLNKHFSPDRLDRGDLKLGDIQNYIDSIQLAARCWHQIHFPEDHTEILSPEVVGSLERIRRLGYGVFRPTFLATLASVKESAVQNEVLVQAERFLLLVRSFASTRSNVGENESYRLARELFRGDLNGSDVAAALRNRVLRHFSVAAFQVQIDELFENPNGEGYYGLNGLHYVLFEYEDQLRREAKASATKIAWDEFAGSWSTIEHIFPQQATDGDWPAFSHFTKDQKRHLAHSLGNLVALSHSKNSSLKRLPFADKVSGTETSAGFSEGSFSENRIALSPQWTAAEIEARGLELLKFIEQRWTIPLGDDATKRKLLKVDVWSPPPSPLS